MRVRSKICGITRVEDALAAVEAGADAIGLVFYARSPRAVSVEQAVAIVQALPPFVTSVGLFVNMPREQLQLLLAQVPLDLLQFHGDESPADCEGFARPYIKALRVRAGRMSLRRWRPMPVRGASCSIPSSRACPGVPVRRSTGLWCRKT